MCERRLVCKVLSFIWLVMSSEPVFQACTKLVSSTFKMEVCSGTGPDRPPDKIKVNVNEQRLTAYNVLDRNVSPCSFDWRHAACQYGEAVVSDIETSGVPPIFHMPLNPGKDGWTRLVALSRP